ncbi:flippase [uncultured Vagococcus sp.]|uniref:flippase n=1 Tax=uncultured Vagococcus sp. TaxID=189676 RepID=UPI0028D63006|nr:flippase [uncultured Vagococcus sp.]
MKSIRNSKFVVNFFSLASVQLLNYVLPLITMPYLVLVLGIENYGLVGFAQAVMQYFILVTDYGFNITATQQISVNRDKPGRIEKIYSTVLICKLILLALCLVILLGMIVLIPKLRENPGLYLLMFGIVVGNVFLPIWFFQGIEEMKNIGLLNFVSKLIFTIGLFIFVKNQQDIQKVALLNSFGYIVVGMVAVLIVRFKYQIKFQRIAFNEIIEQFKSSWHLFISNIATSVYTTTNIFVLGILVGDRATGYFNLANTLIRACASIATPITQTFYPRVASLATTSKEESLKIIRKIWMVVTALFSVGCLILLFGTGPILTLFFGNKFDHSLLLIQIMSFLPLMVAWGNVYGILTMTTFGYQKQLSKIYLIAGCISLVSIIVLTSLFQAVGTAINAMIIETLVTVLLIAFVNKKGISISKGTIKTLE